MSFRPNLAEQYTRPNGQLTIEGMKLLQDLFDRVTVLEASASVLETELNAAEAKLAAIAAVTAPAGGATIDAESRTAINAIIAGAT